MKFRILLLLINFSGLKFCIAQKEHISVNNNIEIKLFNKIDEYLNDSNNIVKANETYENLLNITSNNFDNLSLALRHLSKGKILLYGGELIESSTELFESLKYTEKLKNNLYLAQNFENLAIVHRKLNEIKTAKKYYFKALIQYTKINDKAMLALCENNLGLAYFHENQIDSAIIYYKKSRKNYEIINNELGIAYSFANIGSALIKENNFIEGIRSLKKAEEIIEKKGNFGLIAQLNYEIAKSYDLQQKNELSLSHINKALKLAEIYKFHSITVDILKLKYKIEKKLGLKVEAITSLEKLNHYNVLLFDQKLERRLKNAQLSYNLEKQTSETKLQKKIVEEKEEKNWFLVLGLIGSTILIIIIGYSLYINFKQKKAITFQNNLIQKNSKELEVLNLNLERKVNERTQELSDANAELIKKNFEITEALFKGQTIERKRVAAELHDNLGSTLSALKWRLGALNSEALNSKEKEIYESIKTMMATAYEEVRHISHNLLPAEFEKFGLVGALKKLISEINQNGSLNFDLYIDGLTRDLNKKVALEIYSMSLELINNTLKHSKANLGLIQITQHENALRLIVCDNGLGLQADNLFGKGVSGIKERVEGLEGNMNIRKDTKWNLVIDINIPLNQNI